MVIQKKHVYAPYLLAAAVLLLAAVLVYPYDTSAAQILRVFSHRVGKSHWIQEALNLFRPFGKGDVILLIAAGIGLCGARRRAVHIILALLIMTALIWPFKLSVGRERPGFKNTHSFPSGDVATAAAFCTPFITASPWTAPLAVALTGGVGAGRVYDGRHYPSDALAGAAFGVLASLIAGRILRRTQWQPQRRIFLFMGLIIIGFAVTNLAWARATPFVLDFLRVWGPLGAFLMLATWISRKACETTGPTSLFGIRLPILILFGVALYLTLTTASSLWDRDEPRFSRATVEMVESGNTLFPTFNGQLRPDKPILIYWLMSGPVRLLGPSELSCRMVAPFSMALAALLTFWITRRLAGRDTAILAAIALMFSPLLVASGTAATTDALLLACITGTIASFLLSWWNGFRVWHLVPLITALSAALLTKGPVGLVVPLLVITAVLIFGRNGALRRLPYIGWLLFAVISSVLLFLSWGLPADAATNGEFLRLGIGKHVVSRSVTAMESHGGKSLLFCLYYLPVVILAFFPWTLYLPRAFSRSPGAPAPAGRLLLCWIVPVLLLMSAVATKLPHYILPAFPALAAGAALGIRRAMSDGAGGNRTFAARLGLGLFLPIGYTLGLGLMIAPWMLPLPANNIGLGVRVPATVLGLVFLLMTSRVWQLYRQARHDAVVGTLVSGMVVVLLSAGLFVLPALEAYKLSPKIASAIRLKAPSDSPIATCGYGEPSLNFYVGRGPITPIEGPDLPQWATAPGKGILVVTKVKFAPYASAFASPRIRTLSKLPGFNYSQNKRVEILILSRDE